MHTIRVSVAMIAALVIAAGAFAQDQASDAESIQEPEAASEAVIEDAPEAGADENASVAGEGESAPAAEEGPVEKAAGDEEPAGSDRNNSDDEADDEAEAEKGLADEATDGAADEARIDGKPTDDVAPHAGAADETDTDEEPADGEESAEVDLPGGLPRWVALYREGKIGEIAGDEYYYGVSHSDESRSQADDAARLEFARMVESRVTSTVRESLAVRDSREEYSAELTTEVTTQLSLKGVSITERSSDNGVYYSLIRIARTEYVALLQRNIEEELALRDAELRRRSAEQKAALEEERLEREKVAESERLALEEERRRRELEAEERRAALEEKERRAALREQRRQLRLVKYADFLETQPQSQLVSLRNAQLAHRPQHYGISIGISPGITPFLASNLVYRAHIAYRLFNFLEISTTAALNDPSDRFDWWYEELELKMRLLNHAGKVVRFSLAAGAKGIFFRPYHVFNPEEEVSVQIAYYGAAVMSIPMLLHSHISFYGGNDRIALGLITHPFFGWLGDAFGLVGEASYTIMPELVCDCYVRGFLFQAGVRLKTFDALTTTFTWEDHGTLSLALDLYL